VFGVAALLTGNIINERQAERLKVQEIEIAGAQKSAGEANERAAKLLAFIQPRDLSLKQQRTIGDALHNFAGHKVTVKSLSWDTEGYALGKQLVAVFEYAKLEVSDQTGLDGLWGSVALRGVRIEATPSEIDLARAFAKILGSAGGIKEISVKEVHPVIVEPTGTVPDPRSIFDVFVEAKPFEVLK
jgi:hypothetical protein